MTPKCPRGGADLIEHQPDRYWARYFRCAECMADWRYLGSTLAQGKTRSPYWLAVAGGAQSK